MKNIFALIIFLLVLFFSNVVKSQNMYQVSDSSQAHIIVFVTTDTLIADLKVYVTPSISETSSIGIWYMTTNASQAQYPIYFINDENLANLKIMYVDNPSLAGWINDKSYLFQ